VITLLEDSEFKYHIFRPGLFQIGPRIAPGFAVSHLFALGMFALLMASQYYFARKKLN
jgi:hypothetical protein